MAYIAPDPQLLTPNLMSDRTRYLLPTATSLAFQLSGRVKPPAPPKLIVGCDAKWLSAMPVDICLMEKTIGLMSKIGKVDIQTNQSIAQDLAASSAWGTLMHVDEVTICDLVVASPVANEVIGIDWCAATPSDANKYQNWCSAVARDDESAIHYWQIGTSYDRNSIERLLHTNLKARPWLQRFDGRAAYQLPSSSDMTFSFEKESVSTQKPLDLHVELASVLPIRSIYPRDTSSIEKSDANDVADQTDTAKWGRGSWHDRSNHLPWEDGSGGIIGDLEPPVEPIKAPYLIMNTIEFYAVVGDEQIAVEPCDLGLKLDLDSYAWELTGTLKGITAKNYIIPDVNGPKVLAITINGWSWVFAVKSYKRNSKLVGESYSFTAVSRSQFLTGEWSDKVSYSVDAEVNAWQLAESLIATLGFTLDRTNVTEWVRTPDWTLQAGSVSWANVTPLEIITQLATAAGATVQPHRTDDTIIIAPRYRLSPWEWATAQDSAFSHLIPEAMIVDGTETGDFTHTTELERVLVSGTTHGAVTEVIKRNTAGSVSAADISDVLNQDNIVNAERGRNVLCDSGAVEQLSIQLPLLPPGQAPGLLEPGQLVKILRENGTHTRGMVLSNSIKPDSVSSVWQSAVLEVHHYGEQ